jgi:hypothetical protein
MLVVRPLTVAVSTVGTDVTFKEKVFLSWLAPRGIVAAAVASLFAIHLTASGMDDGARSGAQMRALVFLVIAATVTIQGLTGGPLASLLGLRRRKNDGYMILGANAIARRVAQHLRAANESVVLVDSNEESCNLAQKEGIEVLYGNGLEPRTMMRALIDTRRAAAALTPNESVNFLFARKVHDNFREVPTFVALETASSGVTDKMVDGLPAEVLFGGERSLRMWLNQIGTDKLVEERWELGFPGNSPIDLSTAPATAILPLLRYRGAKPFLVGRTVPSQKKDQLLVLIRQDQRSEAYDWLRESGYVPINPVDEAIDRG